MKQDRTTIWIVAFFGFVIGMFIGGLLDGALGATIDPNREGAIRACWYCPDALLPYLGEMVKVNVGTIFGAVAGLGVGVLVGWALMGRAAEEPETLRAGSKSRHGEGGGGTADAMVSTRSSALTQTLAGREAPTGDTSATQLEQLAALARVDIELHESFDTPTVLKRVHDEAVRISGADFASLILLDWESPQRGKALRVGDPVDFERFATVEEEVMASNRSRIIADFENEPERPVKSGVRSSLLVPVAYDERVIGLIGLHSQRPSAFDADVRDVIELLAAQASVALGNAHRYEEQIQRGESLRLRLDELQNLLNIAATLQPDQSLAANLESVAFGIQQMLGYNIVVFSILNPKTSQLERVAAAGLAEATFDQLKQQTRPWEAYLPYFRAEFQLGMAFFIPREQAGEIFRPFDTFEAAKPAEIPGPDQWRRGDVLLLPIYSPAGGPLGVIYLDDPRDGHTPSRALIDVLEMFAAPTALVIENARLLASARDRINESQERAAQMEALGESAHIIAGALRPDEVIAAALDQLRRVLPYDRVTLYMRDPADGRFRVTASRGAEGTPAELLDRSLFTEIVANRRALVVADVGSDARFPRSAARAKGSWLGVPLVSKGDVVGLLGLDRNETGFYTSANTLVAAAFANQVVVALDNARLFQENAVRVAEVSERARRLALVNTISTELIGSPDADRAARMMLKGLTDALGAEYGAVLLLDESLPDKASLARVPGEGSHVVSLEASGADMLVRRVREALEAVETSGSDQPETRWLSTGIKHGLAVPMLAHNTLVGVALAGRHGEEAAFTADEVELAKSIAGQGALLAQNARRYQKAQQRLVEVSGVAQASRALIAELNIDRLAEIVRTQLAGLTSAQKFVFALYDETRNEFTYPVISGLPAPAPMAPGAVSQFLIQSRQTLLLDGDAEARLRAAGVPDLTSRPGAWDAVSGACYLGVPASLGSKLVGVIQLADDRPDAFSESHERLMAALAPQIAAAIENARQHEQIRQAAAGARERLTDLQVRAAQLEALNEAASSVTGSLRLAEVIDLAADKLQKIVAYDRLTLWLRDSERGLLTVAARRGSGQDVLDTPLFMQVSTSRASVAVPDLGKVEGLPAKAAGAWLGVPVVGRGELIGLFGLEKNESGFYGEQHVALSEAFSTQVANAISNARTYEGGLRRTQELTDRASRSALLSRAAARFSTTIDPVGLAQLGAAEMAAAFQAELAGVVIITESELVAARHPAGPQAHRLTPDGPLFERARDSQSAFEVLPAELAQVEWLGAGVKSALALPLHGEGGLHGLAIVADRTAARKHAAETVETGQTIAQQLAAAVQNALLYQRTQRRVIELGSVSQIGRAVTGIVDLDRLFVIVREQIHSLIPADSVALALYDEARGEVTYPVFEQGGKALEAKPHGLTGLVGHVIRSRQALLVTGAKEEKLKSPALAAAASDRSNVVKGKSLLAAPLGLEEAALGALIVADAKAGAFTHEHERLLVNVASQVATAIANARQFAAHSRRIDELDRRVQSLAIANRMTMQLSTSLDSRKLLLTLAAEMARTLQAERAAAVTIGEPASIVAAYPDDTVVDKPLRFEGDWLVSTLQVSHQPVILDSGHEALAEPLHRQWLGEVRSALVVPLLAAGRLLGMVSLSRPNEAFDVPEIEAAAQLAGLAATALRNAQQFEAAARRSEMLDASAHQLAALSRAAGAMHATLETEKVLPVALQALAAQLSAAQAYGTWLDDSTQTAAAWPEADAQPAVAGDALVEQLRETNSPVELSETALPPAWRAKGIKNALAVPIVAHGRFSGLLVAAATLARQWSAADVNFASELAAATANAMHNASIHERTLKRLVDLGAISQSMRAVAGTSEMHHLFEAVRTQVGALFGARDMSLALYDEKRNEVSFPLAVKAGQPVNRQPAAPDAVLWHIIQTQQPVRLPEATRGHPAVAAANGSANGWHGRSFVGVPLVAGKKTIGVLAVMDDEQEGAFSPEHERLLATLATQVASAIDNVRLFESAQQRAHDLELRLQRLTHLSHVASELGTYLDSRGVLECALREFNRLPGVQRAVVALGEGAPALVAQPPLPNVQPPGPANALMQHMQHARAPLTLSDLGSQHRSELAAAAAPWLGEGATAAVFLPLDAHGAWLGVAALVAGDSQPIPADTMDMAAMLAATIAAALQRTRELERAEARIAELSAANGTLRALQHGDDLPKLWQALRAHLASATNADTFALQLYDENLGEVATPVCVVAGAVVNVDPRLPGSLTRHIILTQRPLLINSQPEAAAAAMGIRVPREGLNEVVRGQSFMGVPLVVGERVTGVLTVASPQPNAFTERNLLTLSALASPFAAGLENARHLARTRGQLARSQTARAQVAGLPGERAAELETTARVARGPKGDDAAAADTAPSAIPVVPAVSLLDSADAETTQVAVRRPSFADDSVMPLSPEQLVRPDDVEYDRQPGWSLGTYALIGAIAVLILGSFVAIIAMATGGLSGLFGQEPTQVAVVTPPPPTPTVEATALIVATALPTDTAAPPTATFTATETATNTAVPTETAVPSETPTPGPTLPPGVTAVGTIQVQPGTSARLRASPNGDVVGSVPDDTEVQVLQGRDLAAGITWVQIRLPSGQVGWIAESLVEITSSP